MTLTAKRCARALIPESGNARENGAYSAGIDSKCEKIAPG